MTVGVNERYPAYKAKSELRNRQRREMEKNLLAAQHKHVWKEASDWNWGPGTVTYECSCRDLRVVRIEQNENT